MVSPPYLLPPKSELFLPTSAMIIKTLLSKTRTRSQRPHLFKNPKSTIQMQIRQPRLHYIQNQIQAWERAKSGQANDRDSFLRSSPQSQAPCLCPSLSLSAILSILSPSTPLSHPSQATAHSPPPPPPPSHQS